MIVVDTSALVAILKGEPDGAVFAEHMASTDRLLIGAPTKFELFLVMGRSQDAPGVEDARAILGEYGIEALDWTSELADIAADAFLRFGKSRHKAQLNFGDCMAYALAKSLDAPLLFKGGDFSKTDVKCAL